MNKQKLLDFAKNILTSFYFKFIVTFIFFFYIFLEVDLHPIFIALRNAKQTLVILAIVVFFINSLFSVWRLKMSFTLFKKDFLKFSDLLKIHYIGVFYNFFLPAPIGGDVSKTFYFPKHMSKKAILSIIFFDRIIGFISLFALTAIALFYNQNLILSFKPISSVWYFVFIIITTFVIVGGLQFFKKQIQQVLNKIKKFNFIVLFYVFIISFTLQLFLVLFNYLIAQSLSYNLNFMQHALAGGLVSFVTVMPITISGYGLREISSIGLYSLFGINSELSLAKVFLGYLIYFLGVIMGWLCIIFNSNKKKDSNVDL